MLDFDNVLKRLGSPGKHYYITYCMLASCYFPIALNHLSMVISASRVSHNCDLPNEIEKEFAIPYQILNGIRKYDSCKMYQTLDKRLGNGSDNIIPCNNGYAYHPLDREYNVRMEFDLVCDRNYLATWATTIYFCGVALGGFIVGPLADRFGRKPFLLACLYLQVVVGIGLGFSNSYTLFVILRFVLGFLLQGLHTCCYVMIMEQSVLEIRTTAGTVIEVVWGLAVIWLSIIAHVFRDWSHIQLAITVPSIITFAFYDRINESMRWLTVKGRINEAQDLLMKIGNLNGIIIPSNLIQDEIDSANKMQARQENPNDKTYSHLDLLRTPKIRLRSMILFYIWFVTALCYYGLSITITDLGVNKYYSLMIAGAIETPAYILAIFVLRWSRKYPLAIYLFLGGSLALAANFVPKDEGVIRTILACIGRGGVAGSFSVIIMFTTELYPTVIRNLGTGTCATWTRIGGIVAPHVITLGKNHWDQLPLVLFGGSALLGSLLALILPDTVGTILSNTIPEAESNEKDLRYMVTNDMNIPDVELNNNGNDNLGMTETADDLDKPKKNMEPEDIYPTINNKEVFNTKL